MSKPRTFLPKVVREELEATGLDWTIERGGKHQHIRLEGYLAGILPGAGVDESTKFGTRNVIASIRRKARELKNGRK
jgi:hypothetical protein